MPSVDNYKEQGGAKWVVGGEIDVTGTFKQGGTAMKFARGIESVTGDSEIDTGLTTVVSVVACLGQDPGTGAGDAAMATADLSVTDGNIILKCWQDDYTAAVNAADVNWIAIGT